MKVNSKILTGFLVGVGLGLTAGLLLAPGRGEETRKQLMKRAQGWKDDLEDSDGVEKLSELAKQAVDTISEYANKVRKGDNSLLN